MTGPASPDGGAAPRLDREHLAAARVWAADRFPYLASALYACELRERPGIGTVAIDERWNVYIDPALANEWTVTQLGSMLVHHVGHALRDHGERGRSNVARGDLPLWIIACDAEINDDLVDQGIALPGTTVLPRDFAAPPNLLAEDYFGLLLADRAHRARCDGDCGSGADGAARPWDDDDGSLSPFACALIRCRCAQEMQDCEGREPGSVPAGFLRWAETILASKVDWRRVLASEIRSGLADVAGAVDYSYRKPSRRAHLSPDIVLPTLRRPVPVIAIVCDTSGSMTSDLLEQALAEVEGLLRRVGVRQHGVQVYACDADVHAARRVTSARQVELVGGGGTDMARGIEVAAAGRPAPHLIVVLTDGYTPWPPDPPAGCKIVVGILGDGHWPVPPWARAVRIDDAA